ncbi:hypothetical protein H6F88_10970 [Oculatella sp. FACHB-28]|uniref:hypothetical protein n=1 Tax=Cyanophyceae TaxID=3028117 RepID=UPI0016853DF0|nr:MULTISPECIES: hypothetical protein [Cyanophyceae]MBD1870792.1 hypothetical protein [Cyanobacteria bacterium FACHB-471]MBD1998301.1 hypothetical protein [Leptolyngbya sp. FACHB-541]MBD2056530.1 hypothetical protein [Oculatella sp. FACHB-28]MBD2069102.1 hypothetical protein [Leptolyngbya sp. FACHB-671]
MAEPICGTVFDLHTDQALALALVLSDRQYSITSFSTVIEALIHKSFIKMAGTLSQR